MRIAVDEEWYDLTKWAKYHPGGDTILKEFDNCDATEAFFSLHSQEAVEKLRRMQPQEAKDPAPVVHPVDKDFQELRAEIVQQFKPSIARDMLRYVLIFGMAALGTWYATVYPVVSILLIGLAMQQAGWTCHELVHARVSPVGKTLGHFIIMASSAFLNGFSSKWWSDKHNTHHVRPNLVGTDPDIHNQPVFFLWAPTKAMDSHYRKYQHLYFLPLYSFLYASWRLQSFKLEFARGNKEFLAYALAGYLWLACLPWYVAIGSVLTGGLFVAIVVTVSHESEEILTEREPSFVVNQFRATRDIACPDFFTEYFFGGMQYQLAHHLVPTVRSYHLPQIKPILQQFASKHGLKYLTTGLRDTFAAHIETLRRNALAAARDEEHVMDQAARKFAYVPQ
eukprot:m.14560 g.14560  ORF g.14560 m.14560 type:complete len:394 (+) comp4844_c0_seq1:155-1336(+)